MHGSKKSLRILHLEDDENDCALVWRHLRHHGYEVIGHRVDTADDMLAALPQHWDVIISDFSMPGFGAPDAIALLKERGVDLPFIIVSGTIDDEMAVDAMRAGAQDFLVKGKLA